MGIEVWPAVRRLLTERVEMGFYKYGTTLRTDNGRSAALDALHEVADLLMYLTQDYIERFGEQPPGTQ